MNTSKRLKWAAKLLGSRYFVVLTDKESVISISGADPYLLDDIVALEAQAAELQDFHSKLGVLIRQHDKALMNHFVPKQRSKRVTTSRNTKAKKVRVTKRQPKRL